MQDSLSQNRSLATYWLKILFIIILMLGFCFRFVNLEGKVYWGDETFTSLRISGYTWAEFNQQLLKSPEITIKDLQKYQSINSEKSVIDTIQGLALEEPQHPPLYYVLARFWVQLFGDGVAVTRSLSAVLSLLVFPCIYWLCKELFCSRLVGLIAMALIAVSPFHVLYAQEAREYTLWIVMILLSSASLLQAMRLKAKLSWVIYALSATLSLYTYPLSILIIIGHGMYVILSEKFRFTEIVISYLVSSILGFMPFAPWLLLMFTSSSSAVNNTTAWMDEQVSMFFWLAKWTVNITRIFIDIYLKLDSINELNFQDPLTYIINSLTIPILILVVYSLYFLCHNTKQRVWCFILILMSVVSFPYILQDLSFGGIRSTVSRYMIPTYLGIELAVAYLLATKITSIYTDNKQRKFWHLNAIAIVTCGIITCAVSSQAEISWNKIPKNTLPIMHAANKIAQTKHPLVTFKVGKNILPLKYLLEPEVKLQPLTEDTTLKVNDEFNDVFLFGSDETLLSNLRKENKYNIIPVVQFDKSASNLWQLKKIEPIVNKKLP